MEFKDVLKKLRAERGLSQAELAKKIDMSKGMIGMYESGNRKPSLEALELIADFFNVSLDYLTGKDERSMYYLDPETAQIAQELYDRPEMKLLFQASRKATPEDVQQVANILDKLGDK